MSNYSEQFGFKLADVKNLASAYSGYASVLMMQEEKDKAPVIASSLLIAALFETIIDPVEATKLFARAADAFHQIGSPLWRLCDICAIDSDPDESDKVFRSEINDEEEKFYIFLQEFSRPTSSNTHSIKEVGSTSFDQYLGRIRHLDIPYRLAISALSESNRIREGQFGNSFLSVLELLKRLNEQTETYQADIHHWKNLEGPIIPFEPIALAMLVVLVKSLRNGGSLSLVLERLRSREISAVLLNVANDMVETRENPSL